MRGASVAAVLSCVFAAATARAQEAPTVSLEVAPSPDDAGCPTDAALRENVARRMGRAPFAPDAPRHLAVSFRRRSRGWSVRLVATEPGSDARAVRDIDQRAPTCAETLPAAGLAVALAIDPDAPSRAAEGPACPACPTCPAAAPCPTCPAPPAPPVPVVCPTPLRPRARVVLSARAGVSVGALVAAPTFVLQARVRLPWWITFAEVGASVATEARGANRLTRFSQTALYGGACLGSAGFEPRLAWFGCLGLQATMTHAAAVEPLVPVEAGARWDPAAYVQLAASLRLTTSLALELGARAALPLRAPRYGVVGDPAPTVDPWPVAVDLTAGPSLTF